LKSEKDKEPLDNQQKVLIEEHIKDPIKEGYTFLKPYIVEFIKNVYILGENFQSITEKVIILLPPVTHEYLFVFIAI